MESYVYHPLDSSSSEIRLLELAPGSWYEDIECQLGHALLSEEPVYEALSYTWGDASNRKAITLSGNTVEITANLETALRHLRRTETCRMLWVDALCINQEDLLERTQQVLIMGDIFQSADMVLAWTGETAEGVEEAFRLVGELSRIVERAEEQPITSPSLHELVDPKVLKKSGLGFWSKPWDDLYLLLNRDYWRRVWVIQELAIRGLSCVKSGDREVVMVGCGSSWLPLVAFRNACLCLLCMHEYAPVTLTIEERRNIPLGNVVPLAAQMVMLLISLDAMYGESHRDVMSLLGRTTTFQATDPRDKVYGLLGIARKEDRIILPDYSKTVDWIRRDLVKHHIVVHKNLSCLSGNRLAPDDQGFEYPSWGADIHGLHLRSFTEASMLGHIDYAASGKSSAEVKFSANLCFLTVKGFLIDMVERIYIPFSPAIDKHSDFPQDMKESEEGMRQIIDLYRSLDAAKKEDLWRTMVTNRDTYDTSNVIKPAPETLHHQFEVLMGLARIPEAFEPSLAPDLRWKAYLRPLVYNLKTSLAHHCILITTDGHTGVGPLTTKIGDLACVLFGGKFCYVLREENEEGCILLGDAYIHGVMHGELMRSYEAQAEGAPKARDFVLR